MSLSTPQCSNGLSQSRPFPARPVKIMESAGHMTTGTPRVAAVSPEKDKRAAGIGRGARPLALSGWRLGLRTKDEVARAVQKKILHPSNLNAFGFGKKSLREVKARLELKPELTDRQVRYWRARCAFAMSQEGVAFSDIARTLRLRGREESRQLSAAYPRLAIANRQS